MERDMNEYKSYLVSQGYSPNQADEYIQYLGNQQSGTPEVIQEMHPSLSSKDRLIAQNLANSPESAVKYFMKQYPDMDIKHDPQSGQYLFKSPGEKAYKVLDPDTGFFSKDILNDVGDVAWDVGAGVAEGAATAGGALAGAAATLPALGSGAIPGAMLAGAASSAGMEAARQKLGQALGIPQDVDMTDVAISGGLGAASPLLFGAGKSKGAIKGAYDFGRNKILPTVAEKVTGVPRTATRTALNRMGEIDNLSANGLTDTVSDMRSELVDTIAKRKREAGKELGDAIESTGKQVDISGARNEILGEIQRLDKLAQEAPTKANMTKLTNAKSAYNDILGIADEAGNVIAEVPNKVSGRQAFNMQEDFGDMADLSKLSTPSTGSRFSPSATRSDKMLAERFRGGYNQINKGLDDATDGLSQKFKNKYAQYAEEQKTLNKHFKDDEATLRTLSNPNAKGKQLLYEKLDVIDAREGTNMGKNAKLLEAYNFFGKPGVDTLSGAATTSTSRTIPLAIAGGGIGGIAGNQMGGPYGGMAGGTAGAAIGAMLGNPAVLKAHLRAIRAAEKAGSKIPNVPDALKHGAAIEGGQGIWEYLANQNQ